MTAILVHCLFYNALFEDPTTWGLLALVVARRARGRPAPEPRVIAHVERALVLAPHTDDGEFGCGGTMARLVEAGADVRYVAFSIATRSLPEGFPPDTLAREVREATAELGIPAENLTVHDFDVRTFPEHRQEILELLIELWNDWRPTSSSSRPVHDVHQDHQTIADEGLRAFKRTTILGYEIPWNNSTSPTRRTSRSSSATSSARSRRSRGTRRSSTAATRTGVHLERRAHARHQRQPRVRRGVPGLPRRRLTVSARAAAGAVRFHPRVTARTRAGWRGCPDCAGRVAQRGTNHAGPGAQARRWLTTPLDPWREQVGSTTEPTADHDRRGSVEGLDRPQSAADVKTEFIQKLLCDRIVCVCGCGDIFGTPNLGLGCPSAVANRSAGGSFERAGPNTRTSQQPTRPQ